MATWIKSGFWEKLCKPCQGYKGWLNLDKLITDIAGPGVPGPQGPQGVQGIQGVQGATGPQGSAGNSVTILGSVADMAAFLAGPGASPGANIGDAWILLSDGSLMSWNGTAWFDAGDIKGPPGDQGPQGEQGVQGIQGIQGVPGVLSSKYGSFYDTTTQTAPLVLGVPQIYRVKFNSYDPDATSGFSIVNDEFGQPTRVLATATGVYNLQWSAQLFRSAGGASKQAVIWIRVNNTDIIGSTGHVTLQANAKYLLPAWNYFVKLNAGDYIQLMWSQDDDIQIIYEGPSATPPYYPGTASVILTLNQIG